MKTAENKNMILTKQTIEQVLSCIDTLMAGLNNFKERFKEGDYATMDEVRDQMYRTIEKGMEVLNVNPLEKHNRSVEKFSNGI